MTPHATGGAPPAEPAGSPPDPDVLDARFTATRADMAAFQRFVTARIRRSVRSPLYWLVLVLAALLAGMALAGGLGVRVDPASAGLVAVMCLGGSLVSPVLAVPGILAAATAVLLLQTRSHRWFTHREQPSRPLP